MSLDADTLLERLRLKQQITRWRTAALFAIGCAIVLAALSSAGELGLSGAAGTKNQIARISVSDVIFDDPKRDELLESIADNDHVKALIVRLDTPGGTAVGGEELYLGLRRIAKIKPVVITMRTVCASAGYMAALGGDYLLAREGTITGSIGVIMEGYEMTDLAKDLGIKPLIFKSGKNKATPNPFEEVSAENRAMIEAVIAEFYNYFESLVVKHRKLTAAQIAKVRDGRIFTGRQALEAGLIDALGGEPEAIAWLEKEKKIEASLPIEDWEVEEDLESLLAEFGQQAGKTIFSLKKSLLGLDGLKLIWQPAADF